MGEAVLERVPTIMTAQEILDKAFARAAKIEIQDPVKYHRVRKTLAARMASLSDTVYETLNRYVTAFPNLDGLRNYPREVLDIMVGLDQLRQALGSVDWAAEKIKRLGQESAERQMRIRDMDGHFQIHKALVGRVSSIVNEIDGALAVLAAARDRVRVLPTISPDFATLVIAGYPNVGKSSLLAKWTNAKPEIAGYAFTTKSADVGHFQIEYREGEPTQYQIVDTPGLLDRPDEDRNDVERHAVAALRHAADAVLFLLDPTETSGYGREQQEKLLEQVRRDMGGIPVIVAETKADIWKSESDRLKISTVTGEGLDELRAAVLKLLPGEDEVELDEDPLDKWRRQRQEATGPDPWKY